MRLKLSVIIPAYDEDECIKDCVSEVEKALSNLNLEFEIVIVDDGSRDLTPAMVKALQKTYFNIFYYRHEVNRGIGAALRTGFGKASGDWFFFMPADGQFDIREIGRFLPYLESADIIVGTKSELKDYNLYRKFISKLCVISYGILFGLRLRDYNYVQMYKRRVISDLMLSSSGIFITGEILAKSSRSGYRIQAVEATYLPRRGGRATGNRFKNVAQAVYEMLKIWLQMHGERESIKPRTGG